MRLPHFLFTGAAFALAALSACQTLAPRLPLATARRADKANAYLAHPIVVGQLTVHPDFRLPADHRMLSELVAEREVIYDRLQLPPSDRPIHVHLFADEANYRQFIARQAPAFVARRAIFIETDAELSVYAHWNDAIAEDLRHEVAHGYLHAAVPGIPLWLDEGLAEYFEVGRSRRGLNRTHVDYLAGQLAVGAWRPNLPRLEQLAVAADMTQLDYAEAWLWVHYLLESGQEQTDVLTNYLAALRLGEPTAPLSERLRPLVPQPHPTLIAHLKSL